MQCIVDITQEMETEHCLGTTSSSFSGIISHIWQVTHVCRVDNYILLVVVAYSFEMSCKRFMPLLLSIQEVQAFVHVPPNKT